jgi:recombination protein RecA
VVSKSKTTLIFINQLREKIGVMFGNPETTTGGRALKFYASVRIDIRRIASIKDGDQMVGGRTAGEGGEEQDGAAVPRGRVRRDVRRGIFEGRATLLDLASDKRIVEKEQARGCAYGGERLRPGSARTRSSFLKDNRVGAPGGSRIASAASSAGSRHRRSGRRRSV